MRFNSSNGNLQIRNLTTVFSVKINVTVNFHVYHANLTPDLTKFSLQGRSLLQNREIQHKPFLKYFKSKKSHYFF